MVSCQYSRKGAAFSSKRSSYSATQEAPVRAIVSSLSAFIAAGLRPRTPLAKAIVLVLVFKLIGIIGIKVLLFPDDARPRVDAQAVARVIAPSTP